MKHSTFKEKISTNNNKQKQTIRANNHEQWRTISHTLKQWEIRLIELRNWGMGYNEISDTLRKEFKSIIGKGKIKSFHTSALRDSLSSGGRLRKAYEIYCEMIAKDSLQEGMLGRKNAFNLAVSTTIALLSKHYSPAVRLAASKDIQDRVEGKAIQKIETVENSEVEEMREKLKWFIEEEIEDVKKNKTQ